MSTGTDVFFTPTPPRLVRLRELAYNLWWTWHPEAQRLFSQIDASLWEAVYHNPVSFLRSVRQTSLEAAAHDDAYLARYDAVFAAFDAYMAADDTWYASRSNGQQLIAYFSAEFGLHEALPIYSGGLGVLAGDHIKEASDLGLPLVAVGFIYPQGFFRQELDASGWQQAHYHKIDFAQIPAVPALDADGHEVVVDVELPGRTLYAKVYRLRVGRVELLLMDTDIHPNNPQDRELSARLYGGDQEMRVAQEIVLGIGGVRALRQLGLQPTVWHMNEGHAAFLVLELAREETARGRSPEAAFARARAQAVFTTHTPVPAGNDAFALDLIETYFNSYWPQLKLDRATFVQLGAQQQSWGTTFAMTVLALRVSRAHNGVSELHGEVARTMWQWVARDAHDAPIGAITNGIHTASWLAPTMRRVYDQALGADWEARLDDRQTWQPLATCDDRRLWRARQTLRRDLVTFVRARLDQRTRRTGIAAPDLTMLDPDALTIGFARRFATYKRATLIFRNLDRLHAILAHPTRPVQIVFAGKSHPADDPGKMFIQQVYQIAQEPRFLGKIVFVEEYDMCVARALVQGADVWLNTPRRPLEASGTSGQKAALNGGVNVSIRDGWWPEAYNGANGWAIGDTHAAGTNEEQDAHDSTDLYRILEAEVVPQFYTRDANDIPTDWLRTVRASISSIAPRFSTRRMVKEYVERMYLTGA